MLEELKEYLKIFTVLLVEDDEIMAQRLSNILSFYFKKVYHSRDGLDGYEDFLSLKPNLVISDIEMKNSTGIELVKNIRMIDSTTPIIILSAYSKEEYLFKLINLKVNAYILKPTTNKKLFTAIKEALLSSNNVKLKLVKDTFLDMQNSLLIYKNKEISLRKKEKYFLELLYKNQNKMTSYDLIQDYIWVDKEMTQNALKTFIKELRQKLPVQIINNIIQEGYKLIDK